MFFYNQVIYGVKGEGDMALLILDALPAMTGKGAILHLLIEEGGITHSKVGRIELQKGRQATVEVSDKWGRRLAKVLDGVKLENQYIRAWCQSSLSEGAQEDHFQRLLRLLELEAQAEKQLMQEKMTRYSPAEAEKTGDSLVRLAIREQFAGLGDRVLVTLGKKNQTKDLPWTRLTLGTPVLLSAEGNPSAWRGVVSQRKKESIQVALSQWLDSDVERSTFRLDLSGDEVARQRQRTALEKTRWSEGERLAELRRVLLLEQTASFTKGYTALRWFNSDLNESQQAAVRFALRANDVGIIHGPPGTGKTTTVVELVRQAVSRGERVLVCAPSNLAVDNLFERLLAAGEKVLRLGHPARVLPALRDHTLDLIVDQHPTMRLARKLARDAYQLRTDANKQGKFSYQERQGMRQEAKQILADTRRMERQTVETVLDSANILCATTTSLDSKLLGRRQFDLCVIDEAAQGTEPSTWIPILRSGRLIFAGDHCQLPPTIISKEATQQGLGKSMMERLMQEAGTSLSQRLTVQYRMNQAIMDFSSHEFYDATLQAHSSVIEHLLADLPNVTPNDLTASAVHFIDTAGAGYDEETESDGESRFNPQEADLVCNKLQILLDSGVSAHDIALITPYAAQARHLRTLLSHLDVEVEIGTVDGFQGREKEAVILSLVRSNEKGDIGFLADERRMNVALTRARRKLLVIGDSGTIAAHPFYQRLLDYFDSIGAYHSVWDEMV